MFLNILLIFIAIVFVLLLAIYIVFVRPEKATYDALRRQGVPGEPFIPLIGQLLDIRKYRKDNRPMDFFENLVMRHGNKFLFCFGPIARLALSDPDLISDVVSRKNAANYVKPPLFSTVFIPLVGKHSLLVAEGSEHERARRMINPAFYHENLKSMISIIAKQTLQAIESLVSVDSPHKQSLENGVDLQLEFNALTLSIIASSAFGSGFETITHAKDIICRKTNEVLEAITYRSLIMVNQSPFLSKLPFWKRDVVLEGTKAISDVVDKIISDRRQGISSSLSDGPDLLDLLLSATDNNGDQFNDQEIKEEALTFVLAGSETTGNLMVWTMYALMMDEKVFQDCREEVDRVLDNEQTLTYDLLSQLVVCEAVIYESLRLYPPAAVFVRQCVNEHTIGTEDPLRIAKDTTIVINTYSLHRRSDLWPNPKAFDYTRWLRNPKTGLKPKLPHPCAYLPFAMGPRNCIGQNFALLEAKIILALLVKHCDFELVPGQIIAPEIKITLRSKYGLFARVTKRKK